MSDFDFASPGIDPADRPKQVTPFDGEDVSETTLLDRLQQKVQAEVRLDEKIYEIATRPGLAVRYDPNRLDVDLVDTYRKKATRGNRNFDMKKFSIAVVNRAMSGVFVDGREATEDGEPLTFSSPILQQMTGMLDWRGVLLKFYGNDRHLIHHVTTLLEDAGFNDDNELDEVGDSPTPLT